MSGGKQARAEGVLSDEQRSRFSRQILLANVGEAGQAAIFADSAAVAPPLAMPEAEWPLHHRVAASYARRAGFARLVAAPPQAVSALAPRALVSEPAAAAVLAGSRLALRALRKTLTTAAG